MTDTPTCAVASAGACTTSEILAVMASRLLKEGQVVFAGVGVPLLSIKFHTVKRFR